MQKCDDEWPLICADETDRVAPASWQVTLDKPQNNYFISERLRSIIYWLGAKRSKKKASGQNKTESMSPQSSFSSCLNLSVDLHLSEQLSKRDLKVNLGVDNAPLIVSSLSTSCLQLDLLKEKKNQ